MPQIKRLLALAATTSLAAALPLLGTTPAQAQDGSFSALTYNIAGLPEFLSSAPTPRKSATNEIGRRIAGFDIVNVQEDFNYHAYLYETDVHAYRTPTSGGVPFGSGLNSLQHQPYAALDRVTWDDCWINQADCLTPKGFTFHRAQIAPNTWIDVYNLHADAGDDSLDEAARRGNLEQLTAYISEHSAGNAVLVMGDTNTRYTREGDRISDFAAANGLTDAWVELVRNGDEPDRGSPALGCPDVNPGVECEVVDKVLYRDGLGVDLSATSYRNLDADFREDGTGLMLSDHFPIAVDFAWTTD